MTQIGEIRVATALVLVSGVLWGFYWIPVRALAGMGLGGAWGTAAIAGAATLLLVPFALRGLGAAARAGLAGAVPVALGGAAFALYSIGFLYGRVALVALLYFLTPVWSVLIARVVFGLRTPPLRLVAVGVGLAGLAIMLGAGGQVPLPRGAGEWMGLIAGVLWSVSSIGIRNGPALPPPTSACVFTLGATFTALACVPLLSGPSAGLPADMLPAIALALGTGALWWSGAIALLIWATARLDPARVGILLMSEVLVGATSAAAFAGEHLSPFELAGGALVLLAGALEIWPQHRAVPI
ncbi:DMT family transporter [Citreimonas salinaria]|uniref:EamA domain-containing membrane protein RarD n=1 Tax=Citreimonas salinaria TaxID=321339 RepID=A0A1H3H296_9RHOB|nr:DMT family transporter [Citreimonas salinaria]SDY09460.1 EamA domain-containing membrane protein RarD [Citreimonas salinaria]